MKTLPEVLQTVIKTYSRTDDVPVLSDIHFQPDRETGQLLVFDDEDHVICKTEVEKWDSLDDESFLSVVESDLKQAIAEVNREGALERLSLWKPYSLVLVDEDRETVCDLLLVDDDTLVLSDELLSDLESDLDAFLDHLLDEE